MSITVQVPGYGNFDFPDGMSQAQMAAAINKQLKPTTTQKIANKAENIWDGFANSNLGSGAISVAQGLGDFAQDIALGVADPAMQLAYGTQNLASRGLSKLTGKPAEDFGMYQGNLIDQAPNPMVAGIASVPGAFALPGGALLKGAKGINALATGAGLGAGYGAAFGASQDPNSDILTDTAIGAAIPAGIVGGAQAVKGGVNAVKGIVAKNKLNKLEKASQKPYSDVKTPEDVAKILNTIGEDVPIDLGTITGSVREANKYKKSSNLCGSNNEERMREAVKKTDNIADRLAAEMSQGVHDEATGTDAVVKHIKENYASHLGKFKSLDEELSTLAKDRLIDTTSRPNSVQSATRILNDLADTETKGGSHFLSGDKNLKRLIENVKSGGSPLSTDVITGAPIKVRQDYNDLKNMRTYVGEQIGNLKSVPFAKRDKKAIGELGEIYYALDDDMEAALQAHPEMLPAWANRSKYYKENVKPYEKNNRIADIVESNDQTSLFTKLNSTDKDIQKVVKDMSPEAQKLLLGLGFKGAIKEDLATGQISGKTAQIAAGYERLNNSPVLKQVLDEKDHALFKKLGKLHGLTKDYRPLLKNPETGAKNTKLLQEAALAIPAALGLGAGAVTGTGLLPAAGLALGTGAYVKGKNVMADIMANPGIAKAYANPSERNALIRESISQMRSPKEEKILNKIVNKASQMSTSPSVINYLLNDLGK